MAFLKIVLVVLALACLAQGIPSLNSFQLDDWKKVFSVYQTTNIQDGKQKDVLFLNVTLTVWGDYNKTTDQKSISDFVQEKITSLQNVPEESALNMYTEIHSLPLQFEMDVKEVITTGPSPKKSMAAELIVKMYKNKKHHFQAWELLRSAVPTF